MALAPAREGAPERAGKAEQGSLFQREFPMSREGLFHAADSSGGFSRATGAPLKGV